MYGGRVPYSPVWRKLYLAPEVHLDWMAIHVSDQREPTGLVRNFIPEPVVSSLSSPASVSDGLHECSSLFL